MLMHILYFLYQSFSLPSEWKGLNMKILFCQVVQLCLMRYVNNTPLYLPLFLSHLPPYLSFFLTLHCFELTVVSHVS